MKITLIHFISTAVWLLSLTIRGQTYNSCAELMESTTDILSTGKYSLTTFGTPELFWCAFDYTNKYAWTLIQSFTATNENLEGFNSFGDISNKGTIDDRGDKFSYSNSKIDSIRVANGDYNKALWLAFRDNYIAFISFLFLCYVFFFTQNRIFF